MTEPDRPYQYTPPRSLLDKIIRFCLEQKLVVGLIVLFVIALGVAFAPFDWNLRTFPRKPLSVDAIPDIGENQQIVFSEWMGRSPKDVDDQVTYPLTVSLLGIPGVKTIRSYSFLGFSMVYVIFEENVPFEDSQNRVIARLNGLPAGILPEGVKPALGPYATALGQIFWYTLEGRDPDDKPVGGWDLNELRTIQDWTVRYHLQSAAGITEVAAIGGFVQEYQIDVDPDAMRAYSVSLQDVFQAVRASNIDVGARQIEVNRTEYLIRARGFIQNLSDIENTVIKVNDNVPIYVKNVAKVSRGPAMREGALDKGGAEAVGAVVVVRHGFNPLQAIKNVKDKIKEIADSLPTRVVADYSKSSRAALEDFANAHGFQAFSGQELNHDPWLAWLSANPRDQWPAGLTTSHVTVVPFYDRTGLIYETLGTLNSALFEQVLITTIVTVIMAANLRVSLVISAVMPLAVAFSFIAMKILGVEANIVSLSGIAIAIGTIVDMGIILSQNIIQHLEGAPPDESRLEVIFRASSEVGSAVLTAIATTVVGFLPVFLMTGPEGKLFKPLAYTKTFCLIGSVIVALTVIPAAAHLLLGSSPSKNTRRLFGAGLIAAALVLAFRFHWWLAPLLLAIVGLYLILKDFLPSWVRKTVPWIANIIAIVVVGVLLTYDWLPLGPEHGLWRNLLLVTLLVGGFQLFYYLVQVFYEPVLRFFLSHKLLFTCMPVAIILVGYTAWLGFNTLSSPLIPLAQKLGVNPDTVRRLPVWTWATHKFPGFGKEFMPPLDEGSFLYMPTTMPHASIGEALDVISRQDMALRAIPEIDSVVGKIGRAETALDPAPVNMIETVISYKTEYITDKDGRRVNFRYDSVKKDFPRDPKGDLIPDPNGRPFRQWRPHIKSPSDIWKEIVSAGEIPGTTSAPRLQPIAARIVMLQSGMRAPMGVKVKGNSLEDIERAGFDIERLLKQVPAVEPATVVADRIIGKPYLEIDINRENIARFGMRIQDVQEVIEVAIGGVRLTTTVEGRQRYPVRVRYLRELRDQIETLDRILVPAMDGAQIPLSQLAEIRYVRGPEAVKSENAFLVGYVLFDKKPQFAEVDTVESCINYLDAKRGSGELKLPAGVSYEFAGNYQNQINAQKTLAFILPLTLFIIFMLIYFQFRSVVTTFFVFSTIFVCWGGGLIFIWLYAQPWFLDFLLFGVNFRDLFQVHTVNMSIAIWVGFLALFGIASDDAVVMCTYLDQRFARVKPSTTSLIRDATVFAGKRRIKMCLMTTATTVLALLPVLTSTGRGADIMVPMSLPSFGGMIIEVITMFMAPVFYCFVKEYKLRHHLKDPGLPA